MSSNDHNFQSPSSSTTTTNTTGDELHRQTPSTTPESRIAAAIGHAIATIPSTSFKEAIANITTTTTTKKPLIRTISDANSSVINQDSSKTTTLTPPTNTHVHCPIPRALLSDIMMTSTDHRHQQPQIMTTRPDKPAIRRALSATAEYQQSKKMTPPPIRKSSSSPTAPPPSSFGNKSPYSEVVKKIEEMVRVQFRSLLRECMVMLSEQEHVENLDHGNTKPSPGPSPSPSQPQAMEEEEEKEEKEECVGVERGKNGDINFELSCSCGKHFEMLIKPNGYCFYKLT